MANKKAKGKRAKTRGVFKKKGPKATVNKLLQEIPVGTKVDIRIDGSMHDGLPDKRYHGFTGTMKGKQGSCFVVALSKGKKEIHVRVGSAHLTVSRGVKGKEQAGVAA